MLTTKPVCFSPVQQTPLVLSRPHVTLTSRARVMTSQRLQAMTSQQHLVVTSRVQASDRHPQEESQEERTQVSLRVQDDCEQLWTQCRMQTTKVYTGTLNIFTRTPPPFARIRLIKQRNLQRQCASEKRRDAGSRTSDSGEMTQANTFSF